jgi:hypothetical protein
MSADGQTPPASRAAASRAKVRAVPSMAWQEKERTSGGRSNGHARPSRRGVRGSPEAEHEVQADRHGRIVIVRLWRVQGPAYTGCCTYTGCCCTYGFTRVFDAQGADHAARLGRLGRHRVPLVRIVGCLWRARAVVGGAGRATAQPPRAASEITASRVFIAILLICTTLIKYYKKLRRPLLCFYRLLHPYACRNIKCGKAATSGLCCGSAAPPCYA